MRSATATLLLLGCFAVAPIAAEETPRTSAAPDAVVLLHGLYRSDRSMRPLALRLEAQGYEVHNLRYPSTQASPDELEAQLGKQIADCCAGAPRLHFVTHSLGGILLRALLAGRHVANLGRVVMLAPPNHGSELVDWLGDSLAFALGPTGRQLGTAPGSLPNRLPPPDYPLGVIAGTWSLNPLGSLVLPGENDGTVSVSSTWLEGMTDFVALPASHTFILRSDAAADQVVEFLRAGHFKASDALWNIRAIRHVGFEDLGLLAPLCAERGHALGYLEAPTDDLDAQDPLAPDLLVVLGGPIGAYEEAQYPFLTSELRLLERRLAAGRPTLGLCLGAQLMARALGARVYPGARKEIGWGALSLTPAGKDSCLRQLDGTRVLHWHGDTFDLPSGARRLASSEITENQAFAFGPAALALQFHAEAAGRSLERWLVGHAVEIASTPGVSVEALRADTQACTPALQRAGRACFAEWLDSVGL